MWKRWWSNLKGVYGAGELGNPRDIGPQSHPNEEVLILENGGGVLSREEEELLKKQLPRDHRERLAAMMFEHENGAGVDSDPRALHLWMQQNPTGKGKSLDVGIQDMKTPDSTISELENRLIDYQHDVGLLLIEKRYEELIFKKIFQQEEEELWRLNEKLSVKKNEIKKYEDDLQKREDKFKECVNILRDGSGFKILERRDLFFDAVATLNKCRNCGIPIKELEFLNPLLRARTDARRTRALKTISEATQDVSTKATDSVTDGTRHEISPSFKLKID